MQLRSIALTAAVVAVVWYWLKSRELKELALRSAANYCDKLSLTLLDQTVVLRALGLRRNTHGRLCIFRRYEFDFSSTGEDRYQGSVTLLGRRVEAIRLQAHRID